MIEDKAIKIIARKLQSTNTEEVLFTIKQLRNTGEPKVLPLLINLLDKSQSEKINESILGLLGDLKNKNCTPELVTALENKEYKQIHKDLLTTCWQSGLDYSDNIELFVDFFISGDFETSFEAFTILDNFEGQFEVEKMNQLIGKLKEKINDFKGSQKEGLFVELIHILERLKG